MSDQTADVLEASPSPRNFRVVALIIASALFLEQLDATILSTALPTIARDMGEAAADMSIALTAYLLSLAIFVPASGYMADRWGAKNIFRAAIIVFTAGSILSAQANSLDFLVVSRFLQGMGGAMMIPVSKLLLFRSVQRHEMVAAMSWLLLPALMGPILGPPLGGFILAVASWRWIFYINIPVGILGVVLVTLFIDDIREPRPGRFDFYGFALVAVGLSSLMFSLEMLGTSPHTGLALLLGAGGLAAAVIYVWHARRHPEPVLDLDLLKYPTFRLATIAGSLTRITQGAQPFLLALMLQVGLGFSAVHSGLVVMATAIGSISMRLMAPRLLRWFGFRRIMVVNGFFAAGGYAVCAAFRPEWPHGALFAVLLASGFFMSLQFAAYNTIVFDEVPPRKLGSAMGFHSTFQQLMLSAGVCTGAAALHASMWMQGHATPVMADFSAAFIVVTTISLMATWWHLKFSADAGSSMSGHRPRVEAEAAEEAL